MWKKMVATYSRGICVKFYGQPYRKKIFDWSYLSEERGYGILTHRYGYKALRTINMHKLILDDFQNNAILLFHQFKAQTNSWNSIGFVSLFICAGWVTCCTNQLQIPVCLHVKQLNTNVFPCSSCCWHLFYKPQVLLVVVIVILWIQYAI